MAIKWIPLTELTAQCRRGGIVPALGIGLSFTATEQVLRAAIPALPAEDADFFPGLGVTLGWGLEIGGHPFNLFARPHCQRAFLMAPALLTAEGINSPGLMDLFAELPDLVFRGLIGIYGPPFIGSGYAVFHQGSLPAAKQAVYPCPSYGEASEMKRRLEQLGTGPLQVAPVEAGPPCWIVAGPRIGPILSTVEVFSTREQAENLAACHSYMRPGAWSVYAGQIGANLLTTYRAGTPVKPAPWIVYRQDDNGNRFLMLTTPTKEDAGEVVDVFTARGHKQIYLMEPA